jgi:chromosome segregation ATPase
MTGYWLNSVGALHWGIKLWGDTELTKDQYNGLFLYAPEHRHAALACTKIGVEYDVLHKQADELLAAVDQANMAIAETDAKLKEAQTALTACANVEMTDEAKAELAAAVEAAKAAFDAASKAYFDAKESVEPVETKLDELRAKLAECPPTRD